MLLRQQLIAARETAKALVASIDAALSALDVPEPPVGGPCQHPPEMRVEAGGMGSPNAYICGACQEKVG